MKYEPTELGDVCDFLRGMTYKPADKLDTDQNGTEAVGVVRTANVQQRLEIDDLVLVPRRMLKSEDKLIREGDIIISSANSWNLVGKCCQAEQDFPDLTFGGFVTNMRPKPEKALPRYVYHFFSSPRVQQVVRSFGRQTTSISNLDLNRTKALKIPLPPLKEQRRIAGILDAADALLRRRREALALLDTLPGAIFAEMFGVPSANPHDYEIGTIGDLLDDVRYGTSKKAGAEGALPILRMGNITYDGRIDLGDLKRIDLPEKDIPKHTVRKGDILFNRTNSADLVGKTAIFKEDEPYAFAGYLVRARVSSNNCAEYVAGYLNSPHGKKVLRNMAKNIVGMANINAKEMQKIPILLAPKDKQESYAERCAQIDERRDMLMLHLSQLEALFASLQSRAFAGEL